MKVIRKQSYYLLWEMVIADFKLRYQGSIFGYLWSLMRPLGLFGILYVVFVHFFRFGTSVQHFPVYLLLGIVLWTFFLEATNAGMRALVDRGELIRKVSLPKYIIIVAPAASAFVNLLLNLVVVFVFALLSHVQFHASVLWLPLILLELLVLSIAVSFLLSALYVRYRDMAYVWELLSQVLFYATPIIYPLNIVPARYIKYLLLSPLAQLTQDARYVLVTDQTITGAKVLSPAAQLVPYATVIVIVVLSTLYFRSRSRYFAEDI